MFYVGDGISNNLSQTNAILKGESILTSLPAGSKLISSIALATPLSSEQQKKRAAMLFGKILFKNTLRIAKFIQKVTLPVAKKLPEGKNGSMCVKTNKEVIKSVIS